MVPGQQKQGSAAASHTGGWHGFWSSSQAGRDGNSVSWSPGHRLPNIHAPFRMLKRVHGRDDLELRTPWGASNPWILLSGLFRNQRQWLRVKTVMNTRETEGNDPALQKDYNSFPQDVSKDTDVYRNKFKTAKLDIHFVMMSGVEIGKQDQCPSVGMLVIQPHHGT